MCALALVLGALPLSIRPVAGAPPGFVTMDGPRLLVDGKTWHAIGVNFWDMEPYKALGNDLSGCYYQHPDLDAYFDASFKRISEEMHATVVRTFAFREWYTAGGRDYSSTDKLLYYAQKYNVRVIPVLGDQFAACGIAGKGLDWYHCEGECTPGYKRKNAWGNDFRSYVVETVARYKDNPTVAFWQIMNEPMYAVRNQERDPYGLLYFTRDIVKAIREEAGDTNHLINAGTGQGAYADVAMTSQLLDCPADSPLGGCADLAEGHDYGGAELNGSPLPSLVGASLSISNSYDKDIVTYPKAGFIDGWLQLQTSAKHNGLADLSWTILLSAPEGAGAWRMYVDDAIVTTVAGPAVYSFEADEQGFTASGAAVHRTLETARTGFGSLAVDVPAGTRVVTIRPPLFPAPHQSIEVWIKLRFDAPAPRYGRSTASMLHQAVTSANRPFFLGEAGIAGQVPGSSDDIAPLFKEQCITKTPLSQRATMFDAMFAKQLDAEHRSAGIVAWDWKDPGRPWTAPDGSPANDKGIGCYTITPGDPAVAIISKWAQRVEVPPLPSPAPLGDPVTSMFVLKGPPTQAGAGSTFPVLVRVTEGGNAVRNFKVSMEGACVGAGKTDALGIASFTCKVILEQGPAVVITKPDPLCDCSVSPVEQAINVGRFIRTGAIPTVVERGAEAPVTVVLQSSDGGSLLGTTWTLPDCGRSGVVSVDAAAVTVPTSCPTAWLPVSGLLPLRVQAIDANGIVSGGMFTLLVFDRLYTDPATGDCIGLAVETGTIGALEQAGACTAGSFGTPAGWFVFVVPPANRAIAFHQVDTKLFVTAAQGGSSNRKVAGAFEYAAGTSRSFTAVVSGRDGIPRALRSD